MVKCGKGSFNGSPSTSQPRPAGASSRRVGTSARPHPAMPREYTTYQQRLWLVRRTSYQTKLAQDQFYRFFFPGRIPRAPSVFGGGYVGRTRTAASDRRLARWNAKLAANAQRIAPRPRSSHVLGRGADVASSLLRDRRFLRRYPRTRPGALARGILDSDWVRIGAFLAARASRGLPEAPGVSAREVVKYLREELCARLGSVQVKLQDHTKARPYPCITATQGPRHATYSLTAFPHLGSRTAWPALANHPKFYDDVYFNLLASLAPPEPVSIIRLVYSPC